jgi:chromate reductase
MKKICIVVASIGRNLKLAHDIEAYLKTKQVDVGLINIVEMDLPLYHTKAESHHSAEKLIAPIQDKLNSDGLIFIAPEYNGGPPPSLTNFIAWVSRSAKNWRDPFNGKAGMIATASGGGGNQVMAVMRLQLSFIGMNLLGRELISTMSAPHDEDKVAKTCEAFLKML